MVPSGYLPAQLSSKVQRFAAPFEIVSLIFKDFSLAQDLLKSLSMLAHVYAAALSGIEATIVKVEVDVLSQGLPGWNMVGLLETAVKEARDRVGSAIRNAGFSLPNRKTIINLSPADLKKSGAHFDLAIAVGLLTAVGACRPTSSRRFLIAGELSLTGKVLPISGALLMAQAAQKRELDGIIVPTANAWEATFAGVGEVIAVETLVQAIEFLNNGTSSNSPSQTPMGPGAQAPRGTSAQAQVLDFSEVRGQPFAKRGLEIAAAGGHNIALKGPPGTGKTMLAERLPTVLPPLAKDEALEVAKIMSWHGLFKGTPDIPTERPFRAPHHTASYAGLIGGSDGGTPRLGEISLAHNGVLFLDELGEFRKDVVEVLRQPMESGVVKIVRAGVSVQYPSRFMLVAAFNPCSCGYFGHPTRPCICSVPQIRRYRSKLSGPLMDRIDLHIEVGPPPHEALIETTDEEASARIRERIMGARARQTARLGDGGKCNANLSVRDIAHHCHLGRDERIFIKSAAASGSLSARAVHRVIKVARTIADLTQKDEIKTEHLAEAFQFRPNLDDIS